MHVYKNVHIIMQVTKDLSNTFICDLGISKLKEASSSTLTTISKGPLGTFAYMAPEMFSPSRRGAAVDIYSFGCLLIELFGQKRLWHGLSGPQIMQMVCGTFNTAPRSPCTDHLEEQYRIICNRCTQLQSKDRPKIGDVAVLMESLFTRK